MWGSAWPHILPMCPWAASQNLPMPTSDSQDVCCPIGWLEHDGSCYWFSPFRLSWSEAQWSCQLQNAHLVVVGSQNEQVRTGRACLGGWLVYLKSSPSSPHRSFLSNTCTLWTPGLVLLTNMVPGHGWTGQTIRPASSECVCALYPVPLAWALLSLLGVFEGKRDSSAWLRVWSTFICSPQELESRATR